MTTATETTSLLTEWVQQVHGLIEAPAQAHELIRQIHASFGDLHLWYSERGDLATAERIKTAYDQAMSLYNQTAHYAQAVAVGQVVVTELDGQRNDALRELEGLTKAIKQGNEAHPSLRWFATSIRAEEREALLDSDEVWMLADESLTDDIYKHLTSELGLPFSAAKTLLNMLQGAQPMTDAQRDAFDAFWPTIDPDRKGSR